VSTLPIRLFVAAFIVLHLGAKAYQRHLGQIPAGMFSGLSATPLGEPTLRADLLAAMPVQKPGEDAALLSATISAHTLTVVAFFETWCGPCRAELPDIEALYETFGPRGVAVVGIYSDSSDAAVASFKQKLSVSFSMLRDTQGTARAAGVDAVPTTAVFNRAAQLVRRTRGADPGLRDFVTQYLAEHQEPAGE
jgi:thiol-disulfide isomerase/thioredoxin